MNKLGVIDFYDENFIKIGTAQIDFQTKNVMVRLCQDVAASDVKDIGTFLEDWFEKPFKQKVDNGV